MKQYIVYISIISFCLSILLIACEKDDPVPPDNPYDEVDYTDSSEVNYPVEPNSIVWLHEKIFLPKCANAGCHDGHFEPDFRSVQSSYSTLVYHSIIKNNASEDYTYRVVPYDTSLSVLYERITNCCFVNTNDRMPQSTIGESLPDEDIQAIAFWIMDGAKDLFGNEPVLPNNKVQILYYFALSSDLQTTYSNNRLDGIYYESFIVPANADVLMAIQVEDDETPVSGMQINRLDFSYDKDDFSNATSMNTAYLSIPQGEIWTASFNTSAFLTDTIVYMRYTCSDGEQADPSVMPKPEMIDPYKTFWSFYVQP